MARVVAVGSFDSVFAAHHAMGVLAEGGVEAEIFDQQMGTAIPVLGATGVRVVVRAEDAERARALLATAAAHRQPAAEAPGERPGEDEEADEPAAEGAPSDDPPVDVEAWASRTRTIAFCGIAIPLLAVVALWRISSPPEGIETSPRAMRMLSQARWAAWITLGVVALALLRLNGIL
ncbi:MAG TPA: DUF2007 domain-containing protein [Planctomycetota bacterium]|nr:DUF2007 domain-containing protein [Planctomycetota bacterium]